MKAIVVETLEQPHRRRRRKFEALKKGCEVKSQKYGVLATKNTRSHKVGEE